MRATYSTASFATSTGYGSTSEDPSIRDGEYDAPELAAAQQQKLIDLMNIGILNAYINEKLSVREEHAVPQSYRTDIRSIQGLNANGSLIFKEKAWVRYRLPFNDIEQALPLEQRDFVDVFVENAVNNVSFIAWHTSSEKIRRLQEWGGISGEAFVAKIISKIAEYRSLVAKRVLEAGIMDQLSHEEERIVDISIQRLRLIEPLEQLINSIQVDEDFDEDETASVTSRASASSRAAIEYQARQVKIKTQTKALLEAAMRYDESLINLHERFNQQHYLVKSLKQDKETLRDFISELSVADLAFDNFDSQATKLQLVARTSITNLITRTVDNILNYALGACEALGYRYKNPFRGHGHLHDFIIDAVLVAGRQVFDSNKTPNKTHHLDFSAEDTNQRVIVDTRNFGIHSRAAFERFLRGIYLVELDMDFVKLEQHVHNGQSVKKISLASWGSKWRDDYDKKPASEYVLSAALAMPNFFVTLFGSNQVEEYLTHKTKIDVSQIDGLNYSQVLGLLSAYTETIAHESATKARYVGSVIRYAAVDSVVTMSRRTKAQARAVYEDFKIYGYPWWHTKPSPVDEENPEPLLADNNAQLELRKKVLSFGSSLNKMNQGLMHSWPELSQLFANCSNAKIVKQDSLLIGYRPYDLITGFISGVRALFDYFKDEVHAKHPLIGGMSMFVYYYCFMASFNPDLIPFFLRHQGLMDASNTVGNAMAHGKVSAGIGSGFLFYKGTFGLLNMVQRGPDSWLWDLASAFGRNPGLAGMAILSAWLTGHTLTTWVNVPFLSDELREDLGDIPFFAELFAGLKLLVLTFEFFSEDERHEKSYFGQMTGDLVQLILTTLRFAPLSLFSGAYEKTLTDMGRFVRNIPAIAGYNIMNVLKTLLEYSNLIARDVFLELIALPVWTVKPELAHVKQDIAQTVYEMSTGAVLEVFRNLVEDLGRGHMPVQGVVQYESLKEQVQILARQYVEQQVQQSSQVFNSSYSMQLLKHSDIFSDNTLRRRNINISDNASVSENNSIGMRY